MHLDSHIDSELLDSFVEDTLEALYGFERIVLSLEPASWKRSLQDLFRASHTLKGAAMLVGFEQLVDFLHKIEDLIQASMGAAGEPDEDVLSVLFRACHCMVAWVRRLATDPGASLIHEEVSLELERLTHRLRPRNCTVGDQSEEARERRFSQDELDSIMREYGWHRKSARGVSPPSPRAEPEENRSSTGACLSHSEGERRDRPPLHVTDSLKISAQELDDLIGLIQKLSENEEALLAPHDSVEEQKAAALIQAIQSKVRELRVQSLQGLFKKLEKTAAALAKSQKKEIKVILKGAELQLDKRALRKISGPLMHIVRNAVDHGIESPRSRSARGKRRAGVIQVVATQTEATVSIKVSDDGCGLNAKDIRAAAVRRGLIKEGQRLSSQKIYELIFLQGISTALKLTKVSGRGIGMDIVKHTVEVLGGTVSLKSRPGKGTAITITLPREF